jgi:photosystem II stability/assembly factor-like uncharacterized protein
MASDKTLLLGTRKGLLTFHRNGDGWSLAAHDFPGVHIQYACADPRDGTRWACLNYGHWGQHLHRSRDDGETWQEVTAPAYPEGTLIQVAGGTDPMGVVAEKDVPAKLQKLWCVTPAGRDTPGRLYIGTAPGGLFRSDDGGDTFELIEGLWNHPSRMKHWFSGGEGETGPVLHSVVEDPRNPDHLYVGISCAGVFETTDGGANWEPRNNGSYADFLPNPHAEVGHDAHCLMGCRNHPDVLWQQNHCGIFRTADGGQNWEAVSQKGSLAHFGFPIAVDPDDPDTAWVVPGVSDEIRIAVDAALCVCRTTDGGRSWEPLRNGLPQQGVYDIVFRHALDLSGEDLAFGSTTGNTYVSADRGETWDCLGSNLPPVYSVRFA